MCVCVYVCIRVWRFHFKGGGNSWSSDSGLPVKVFKAYGVPQNKPGAGDVREAQISLGLTFDRTVDRRRASLALSPNLRLIPLVFVGPELDEMHAYLLIG